MRCSNFTQFASTYKVSRDTLTDWYKELKNDPDVLNGYTSEYRSLTKAVIMALYVQALKHGDAERTKTWMTFVEGWTPREQVQQTATHFDIVSFIEQIEERNRKIRDDLPDNQEDEM